jgi:hypothetical protein
VRPTRVYAGPFPMAIEEKKKSPSESTDIHHFAFEGVSIFQNADSGYRNPPYSCLRSNDANQPLSMICRTFPMKGGPLGSGGNFWRTFL